MFPPSPPLPSRPIGISLVTTQRPHVFNRRRLLGSSAVVAAWVATGCDRSEDSTGAAAPSSGPPVPLRVTFVGQPQDAEAIRRGWASVSDQPIDIAVIDLDRAQPEGLADEVLERARQTDVAIVPLALIPQAVHQQRLLPLTADEFQSANEELGEIVAAVRNGAARYAGESYCIPLGAQQPFLISTEEVPKLESWEAYDQLVERWEGLSGEPTAPGWAGAMFLWRSAAERNWLFGRERLEPLVQEESYVRSLELMVQTCSRYPFKKQTPQQVWEGIASAKLRGGIAFPERRSQTEAQITVQELPGTSDGSRVLLDPFSPMIGLAASCRQTALAKQFMVWISGGEGSRPVRQQVLGMSDTRGRTTLAAGPASANESSYDRQLMRHLANPVTMPTLQLLDGGSYYGVLDRQVLRAIEGEATPSEALAEVASQWESLTARVGQEDQIRVWRRAQGMRG